MSDTDHQKDSQSSGQCLCGSVKYQVQGALRPVVHCYCGQCRRTHGLMGPYTQALRSDIHFIEETGLKWYLSSDHAERGFCDTYGSSLFWHPLNSDRMCISAGTLDHPTGLIVTGHIYTNDLADFHMIPDDGLPRYKTTSSGELDGDLSS